MNTNQSKGSAVIWIIVILVLVFGVILFANKNSKENSLDSKKEMMNVNKDKNMEGSTADMMKDKEMSIKEEVMEKDRVNNDKGTIMTNGSYEDYASSKLALAETGKVVLFFKASWCPSCRAVDKDIMANITSIPKGVNILKVDYDNSKDLKLKYGVTYQHTFVQVDKDGKMIAKWSGSPTLSDIVDHVK